MILIARMRRLVALNATVHYVSRASYAERVGTVRTVPRYFELFETREAALKAAQMRDHFSPLGAPPAKVGSASAMQFDIWTMQPLEGTLL